MEQAICEACGSKLLTWTEEGEGGTTVLVEKCEHCRKIWRITFDAEGDMIDATVEDYED